MMDAAKRSKILCEAGKNIQQSILLSNGRQRHNFGQNEELSRLENDIKKAYVLKSLEAQIAERKANRLATDIQSRIAEEITRCYAAVEDEKRTHFEEAQRARRTELTEVLKRQIEEKRNERNLLEQEERKERQLLVEIDRIREEKEQFEKAQSKEQLAEQLLLEELLHWEIREINKSKLEELEVVESKKNRKYIEELEKRAQQIKEMKQEAQKRREETISRAAKMLMELQHESKERKQLLVDIMVEEVKFHAELEAREAELRRRQKIQDLAEGLEEQMRFKEECRRRFLEREKQFAETVMAKIMESEEIERLTVEMRRRRRLEYREQLENLMRKREQARIDEFAKIQADLEKERAEEKIEREAMRESRMLLLKEHIDNVADFMNKKLLYDEERAIVDKSRLKK